MSSETWNRFLKEFGMLPGLVGLRAADIIHKRSFGQLSVMRSLPPLQCYVACARIRIVPRRERGEARC